MSSSSMTRRDALAFVAGATVPTVLGGSRLFAGEPLFPNVDEEVALALEGYEFQLPSEFHTDDGQLLASGVQFAGEAKTTTENVVRSFRSTQVPDCETAVVQTPEQARHACAAALRTGRFNEARVAVARPSKDAQGRDVLVFDKDNEGLVKPSATYRSPQQIGMTNADLRTDELWTSMLADVRGHDGASALELYQDYDRQLWLPDQMEDPFMYAGGGLFNGGLFSGRRRQSGGYGHNSQVQCQPSTQGQCGYSYGRNCSNCNLRPLGTIGGLLRGEFLRPLRSTGGIRHLKFGQRIVARLFPRIAYNKGWVNCETAHLLLVKRLFWAIVIGGTIGAAAGGGGAAGLIFLG